MNTVWIAAGVLAGMAVTAVGQNSSLWQPRAADTSAGHSVRDDGYGRPHTARAGFEVMEPKIPARAMTQALERMSLIAVPAVQPRKFKVNDLITIIVRQQKKYEADGKLDTKKQWDISGKLSEWFRFYPRNHLGTDQLSNGKPGFDFKFDNRLKTDAENEREDKFITRFQARIIDVKPNGNLTLEATVTEQHDEEEFTITMTGVCRSDDVTPDNSILSTQIAEMVLIEKNKGAVRDSTRRGWVPRAIDWLRPF